LYDGLTKTAAVEVYFICPKFAKFDLEMVKL
jgi:hypothetical protein